MAAVRVAVLTGIMLGTAAGAYGADLVALPKETYLDKCRGAWAGQMIGVCYGGPYEFKSNGKILEGDLQPWKPKRVNGALGQDDLYVEMTFLAALEKYGLDITHEQAGRFYGETAYAQWHCNRVARANIRNGIMPPLSGYPMYNRHADDVGFSISSDLLGIISPGMPQESNRLGEVFGHIMNYGDGVYGGLFMAGMYAAAFFENNDVLKVVQAGLACIPEQSKHYKCVADVIRWHKATPGDWRATWKKIEERWNPDDDCVPGNPMNVGVTINDAYVVMGLLYGQGDFLRTLEIATRCGQDADCNPSSAGGVLGCMKGYRALGEQMTGGIPPIEDRRFEGAGYSFKTLIPACLREAEQIVVRGGGKVTKDALLVARQDPRPPATLEQWIDRKAANALAIDAHEMSMWDPGWRLLACSYDADPGYIITERYGREHVLRMDPFKDRPAAIAADLQVPASGQPRLDIDLASHRAGKQGFVFKILLDGKLAKESRIMTAGQWVTESVDLTAYSGKIVNVRLEMHADGGVPGSAFIQRPQIKQGG